MPELPAAPRVAVEVPVVLDAESRSAADRRPSLIKFRSRAEIRRHVNECMLLIGALPDDGESSEIAWREPAPEHRDAFWAAHPQAAAALANVPGAGLDDPAVTAPGTVAAPPAHEDWCAGGHDEGTRCQVVSRLSCGCTFTAPDPWPAGRPSWCDTHGDVTTAAALCGAARDGRSCKLPPHEGGEHDCDGWRWHDAPPAVLDARTAMAAGVLDAAINGGTPVIVGDDEDPNEADGWGAAEAASAEAIDAQERAGTRAAR
jgi:hypothetical protein